MFIQEALKTVNYCKLLQGSVHSTKPIQRAPENKSAPNEVTAADIDTEELRCSVKCGRGITFSDFANFDYDLPISGTLLDADIVSSIT